MKNTNPAPTSDISAAVEADELYQDRVGAFIERNHDALDASIERGRQELGKGTTATGTIGDIIAEGRRRHA